MLEQNEFRNYIPQENIDFGNEIDEIISKSSTHVISLLKSYCRGVELNLKNNQDLKTTLDELKDTAEKYNISEKLLNEYLQLKLSVLNILSKN